MKGTQVPSERGTSSPRVSSHSSANWVHHFRVKNVRDRRLILGVHASEANRKVEVFLLLLLPVIVRESPPPRVARTGLCETVPGPVGFPPASVPGVGTCGGKRNK